MKCPHCLHAIHIKWGSKLLGSDIDYQWFANWGICPNCEKSIITLTGNKDGIGTSETEILVYPKGYSRTPLDPVVPSIYSLDYQEACKVLQDSPKASAALSRRCLQNLLRDVGNVKPSNLSKEIDEVLKFKSLPSQLADAIDAIRNIGNFAAHPIKSNNSGAIVEVEAGEAEWLLDVLEGLFDYYFVQPDLLQKKKDALNIKLADAGKPPMK